MMPTKIALVATLLAGCAAEPTPLFKEGDFVRSVVSEERGQILSVSCRFAGSACFYDVRFSPHLTIKQVREYEIRADGID